MTTAQSRAPARNGVAPRASYSTSAGYGSAAVIAVCGLLAAVAWAAFGA